MNYLDPNKIVAGLLQIEINLVELSLTWRKSYISGITFEDVAQLPEVVSKNQALPVFAGRILPPL